MPGPLVCVGAAWMQTWHLHPSSIQQAERQPGSAHPENAAGITSGIKEGAA